LDDPREISLVFLFAKPDSRRNLKQLEIVRFTQHSEETFLLGRRAERESAITYEFSALSVCRKTDEFLPVTAAVIGRFSAFAEKA
jgi:hypothetical protein